MSRPKKLTRAQEAAAALIDAHRDDLGRMRCEHGTPDGAQSCALCRRQILALHEGYVQPRRDDGGGVPMPDWFRSGMAHPEQWAPPVQPTLIEEGDDQ
jgi:hypothetical protein